MSCTEIKFVKDINAKDKNPEVQRTALHWAAAKGHEQCYELLLKHNADPLLEDAQGETPLFLMKKHYKENLKLRPFSPRT